MSIDVTITGGAVALSSTDAVLSTNDARLLAAQLLDAAYGLEVIERAAAD